MNINKIAELSGVSRTTVSRFLNDGYVSEINKTKIQKVIDETGFERVAGGAPANVAAVVAKLGGSVNFISQLGKDVFGDYIMHLYL